MSKTNKILLLIFIAFLFVASAEIVYFLSLPTQKPISPKKIKSNQSLISALFSCQKKISSQLIELNNNHAVSTDNINSLSKINKGITKSLIMEATFEGKVVQFDKNQKDIPQGAFALRIRIKGADGKTNSLYFNPGGIKKMKVLDKNRKTISLDEIKINDTINIKQKIDLLKSSKNNFIEGEIIKL